MPMIIASAVIMTGRNRVDPASTAAFIASPVAASLSRAKEMTSTLFAVATPMHMIRTRQRGNGQRGLRHEQHPHDPRERGRKRRDDDRGIDPGTES